MIMAKLITLAYVMIHLISNAPNGSYPVKYHDSMVSVDCLVSLADDEYSLDCEFSGIDDKLGNEVIQYLVDELPAER